jgi:hypothetical protein
MSTRACILCRGLAAGTKRQATVGGWNALFSRQAIPLAQQGQYRLLNATIGALRIQAPAAFPIIVRSGWNLPADADAYCIRRESRFVIMLGQHLGPKTAVEALLHEWGHARAWNHRHDQAIEAREAGSMSEGEFEAVAHDGAWGVEFAHCWRVYTGKVLPGFGSSGGLNPG